MRSLTRAWPSFEEIGQHAVAQLSKVRRGEGFMFSWEYARETGSGHSTIWIHPAIPLQFDYFGGREPRLNRSWIEELVRLANSCAGLRVVAEPAEST